MTLLLLAVALADPYALPAPPAPHAPLEDECPTILAVSPGRPLEVLDAEGRPLCGGVLVPTSVYLTLLDAETDARQVRQRHALDVGALQRDLGWERTRREQLEATLAQPVPWLERPGTQRLIGEVHALVVVAAVAGIAVGAVELAQ